MEHAAHGLVHGQLRPEHVLLGAYDNGSSASPAPRRQRQDGALATSSCARAPELQGRSVSLAAELRAADVWSLGTLHSRAQRRAPFFSTVDGACSVRLASPPGSPAAASSDRSCVHPLRILCAHSLIAPHALPGIRAYSLTASAASLAHLLRVPGSAAARHSPIHLMRISPPPLL